RRLLRLGMGLLVLAAAAGAGAPAGRAANFDAGSGPGLDLYRIRATAAEARSLEEAGVDIVRAGGDGTVEAVLTPPQVTGHAARGPDGTRPAVLYLSLQHAREWISGEVTRRLLHSLVDAYGTDPDATHLLDTTELWFIVVANPDGYQLTFDPSNRLWRK